MFDRLRTQWKQHSTKMTQMHWFKHCWVGWQKSKYFCRFFPFQEDINCAPGPISSSVSTNRTVEEQKMWDQRVGLGLASSRAKSASQIGLFPMANGGTENGMETPMENGIGTYSQLYGTFVQNTSNGTVGHRNSMPPPATNDGRPSSQQQVKTNLCKPIIIAYKEYDF
jgi:hypothetical protein